MSIETMPTVFTFPLVDMVAQDMKLSKNKARKAILRGKVEVNGAFVRDPDVQVDKTMRIVFHP